MLYIYIEQWKRLKFKQSYLTLIIGWARDFLNFLLFIDSMKQIKYIVGWIQTYAILGYKLSIYIRTRPPFFNYEIWIKNMREKPSLDPPPPRRRKGRLRCSNFSRGGGCHLLWRKICYTTQVQRTNSSV